MARVVVSKRDHTALPPRASATAVLSSWDLPRRRTSCARASAMLAGLLNISAPHASTWSAPMTSASGKEALTTSALATAKPCAISLGVDPERKSAPLTAASSTSGAATVKASPAASSMRRRNGLADAKMSPASLQSTILQLPRMVRGGRLFAVVQQPDDGGCRLLDGSARHVDNGPTVLRAQSAREAELVGNLGAVDVFVEIAVSQHPHAIATDLGDALGACHQTHDKGSVRLQQRRRRFDARDQRQVRRLVAALGEIEAGGRLGGSGDAEDDDIRGIEILGQRAVVVRHGEV